MFKLFDYFKNVNSYKDLKVKDVSNVLKQNKKLCEKEADN